MIEETQRINKTLLGGWTIINLILFTSYILEAVKGTRTFVYVFVFMIIAGLPELISFLIYRKKPDNPRLKYSITKGYFIMYLFVMITGNTTLVFTYIFPMISMMILYHDKHLIFGMGIAALLLNIFFIVVWTYRGYITLENSRDVEIQIALIILCFAGCYAGSHLYDTIIKRNKQYVNMIDRKTAEMQEMTLQAIATIVNTIDAKDEFTIGHSMRVADYSYVIAKNIGMSDKDAENVKYVAMLHDIGKIGVPDSILKKKGPLTDEEFEIMKTHTTIGAKILKDIKSLPGLDVGTKYHHERYDGKGYPCGLNGDEIPLVAQIISIADAYDAMSNDRIYRRHLSDEDIFAEFQRCRGAQFSPELTDLVLDLLRKRLLVSKHPRTTI
jgi:putative nucleotidyltransferase with HDIG domain